MKYRNEIVQKQTKKKKREIKLEFHLLFKAKIEINSDHNNVNNITTTSITAAAAALLASLNKVIKGN